MEELVARYQQYLARVQRLERDRKPFEGAFGLGGPANSPCHREFAQDVEEVLAGISEDEIPQILEFIYRQPLEHQRDQLVYGMFLAVHGATVPYIRHLTQEQARALGWWYQQTYPHGHRLPCQERVITALGKRARG